MKDNFSLRDFQTWLDSYNQSKKNQQDFGIKNFPARFFRKTIDMTVAGNLQTTGLPFTGAQVEKIYSTASGLSVDGNIRLNIDRGAIDKDFTYKKLFENDSFELGFSAANGFLTWTAQPGVSVDLVFFNDVFFRSGSQKTTVAGTISTANTNATSFYNKPPIPSIVTPLRISATNANIYTVPVGKYAVVNYSIFSRMGGSGEIQVGGQSVMSTTNTVSDVLASGRMTILAGSVISSTSVSGVCILGFLIEEYNI